MRCERILFALLVGSAAVTEVDAAGGGGTNGDYGTGPSLDDDLEFESGSTPPAQPPFAPAPPPLAPGSTLLHVVEWSAFVEGDEATWNHTGFIARLRSALQLVEPPQPNATEPAAAPSITVSVSQHSSSLVALVVAVTVEDEAVSHEVLERATALTDSLDDASDALGVNVRSVSPPA